MRIGTHSGGFHCDDVFAVGALKLLYPDAEVVRSRDPDVWKTCDFLVDVGGLYSADSGRYDHHFRNGPAYSDGLLMSSFGLVWKHHGKDLCGGDEQAAERVCEQLVRPIDAHDNGISLSLPNPAAPSVRELNVSVLVAVMNPIDAAEADTVFLEQANWASGVIRRFSTSACRYVSDAWSTAEAVRQSSLLQRPWIEVPESVRWQESIHGCADSGRLLYVLFPKGGNWYVQAVTQTNGGFRSRKPLPSTWAGLEGAKLSEACGVPDAIFCHHSAFTCSAKSRDGALRLLDLALHHSN